MKKQLLITLIAFLSLFTSIKAQTWQMVGSAGIDGEGLCMAVYQDELYMGGRFSTVDGKSIEGIARWNGDEWKPVGKGSPTGTVFALQVYKGELYAAGAFDSIGGIKAHFIAKWNGKEWSAVDKGTDGQARVMAVYNNKLYIAGKFEKANGKEVNHIVVLDGTKLTNVGKGSEQDIFVLRVVGNRLFAWPFSVSIDEDETPESELAAWDGKKWDTTGCAKADTSAEIRAVNMIYKADINKVVLSNCWYNNELYAAGYCPKPETGSQSILLYRFTNKKWVSAATGLDEKGEAHALIEYKGSLYTCGAISLTNKGNVGVVKLVK